MGWVLMSERDVRRIEVLSEVLSGQRTRRLVAAYRDGGGGAMIHKARGRASNN